uniref:(northern house mosquito) hypothetical protein n=1 Tax=Culex pipiens TaxID=7175 RepID=A0A8D8MUL1_CULPI
MLKRSASNSKLNERKLVICVRFLKSAKRQPLNLPPRVNSSINGKANATSKALMSESANKPNFRRLVNWRKRSTKFCFSGISHEATTQANLKRSVRDCKQSN